MEKTESGWNPAMQLCINSSAVTVMFSRNDTGADIKSKVRDIFTEAYEERFQKEFILCRQEL